LRTPTALFKLHAHPVVEEELDWFFTRAESEMGVSSNFAPLAAMALTGIVGSKADPADMLAESRVAAAHAEGQIRRRLDLLPVHLQGVLYTAFEPRGWPKEVLSHFGRGAGIAVRTVAARRAFQRATRKKKLHVDGVAAWLAGAIGRHEHSTVTAVKLEAEGILAPALHAYAGVRGNAPNCVPGGEVYAGAS
jgi:hypothetical protein